MFTRQYGRLSFAVQLPRSPHAKLKKQYFQPLTLLNIEADIRQQANLQKISEVSLLSPLPSLLSEPSKLAIGLFVSEFLHYALRDEQQNEPLFDYVRSSIEWLDSREQCQLPSCLPHAPQPFSGLLSQYRGLLRGRLLRPARCRLLPLGTRPSRLPHAPGGCPHPTFDAYGLRLHAPLPSEPGRPQPHP